MSLNDTYFETGGVYVNNYRYDSTLNKSNHMFTTVSLFLTSLPLGYYFGLILFPNLILGESFPSLCSPTLLLLFFILILLLQKPGGIIALLDEAW